MIERRIPVLTDVVAEAAGDATPPGLTEEELSELQTRLATEGFALMERLLREAFREMEMNLMAEVIGRLRHELPELMDDILREHFGDVRDPPRRA
jgi:hypothetical protein